MTIGLLEKRLETAEELEAVLQEIASKIYSRSTASEVRVFGSACRADRKVGSDIDICAIFESPAALREGRKTLFGRPLHTEALDLILLSRDEYHRMKDVGGIAFEICHYGRPIERENL